MKTIASVAAGERIEHKGDLTISGDVGERASISVTEGSLIIEGQVGSHVGLKVSVSETLRQTSTDRNWGTSMSIGGSTIFHSGGRMIGRGASIRADMQVNQYYMGNVVINDRIFTDGPLQYIGSDEFLISAAPDMPYSRLLASSSSSTVSAQIDGKRYTGTTIRIVGSKVYVDGRPTFAAEPLAEPSVKKPISPPRLEIKGPIHNAVSIQSDVGITMNVTGESCHIVSHHGGITATDIGQGTRLEAKAAIQVGVVEEKCKLTSHQYGVTFGRLADQVTVSTRDAITGGDVGDNCVLTSAQYGLTAKNLGAGVLVTVRDAIKVANIGVGSRLISHQYGLSARAVADFVTIEVRDEIELARVGSDCQITSHQYGIHVDGDVGARSSLTGRDDIFVDNLGNNSRLTSHQNKIRVRSRTGDRCVITARDTIRLGDVGDSVQVSSSFSEIEAGNIGRNVHMTARSGIDVTGTSPDPDSCVLTCAARGKINRPKPAPVRAAVTPTAPASFFGSSAALAPSTPAFDPDSWTVTCATKENVSKPPREPAPVQAIVTPAVPASFFGSSATAAPSVVPASQSLPDSLCCPITLELMDDPVFCTLDCNTYERAPITSWLEKNRRTPTNEMMEASQTVADVLRPNRKLKEAIEEYRALLPKPAAS